MLKSQTNALPGIKPEFIYLCVVKAIDVFSQSPEPRVKCSKGDLKYILNQAWCWGLLNIISDALINLIIKIGERIKTFI